MSKKKYIDIEKPNFGETSFIDDIRAIVSAARDASYRMANLMQVVQNWLVGRRIVEQEQQGKRRADYGKRVIEMASQTLTEEFGSGFQKPKCVIFANSTLLSMIYIFSRRCLLNSK